MGVSDMERQRLGALGVPLMPEPVSVCACCSRPMKPTRAAIGWEKRCCLGTYWEEDNLRLMHGDAREVMASMEPESVSCCITSPPFWGLRKYDCPPGLWADGAECQFGLEPTVQAYVEHSIEVLRAIRRVLRRDGVVWWDIDDSRGGGSGQNFDSDAGSTANGRRSGGKQEGGAGFGHVAIRSKDVRAKSLALIPQRIALAAQEDGWIVRSQIIIPTWMPESARDRPTDAYRVVLMLTRSKGYWYDAQAVRVQDSGYHKDWHGRSKEYIASRDRVGVFTDGDDRMRNPDGYRNLGNVWDDIGPASYPGPHFATFPIAEAERAILASCPEAVCRTCGKARVRIVVKVARGRFDGVGKGMDERKAEGIGGRAGWIEINDLGWTDCGHDAYEPGLVLDPFVGTGTSLIAARKLGRRAIGIDLSEDYLAQAVRRLTLGDTGIRAQIAAQRNGAEQPGLPL